MHIKIADFKHSNTSANLVKKIKNQEIKEKIRYKREKVYILFKLSCRNLEYNPKFILIEIDWTYSF